MWALHPEKREWEAGGTCSGLRSGGRDRWLCKVCIAALAAANVVYLTKQQPCDPKRMALP